MDPLKEKGLHHILHIQSEDAIFYGILSPIQEDHLVLIALGGMLNQFMINCHYLNSSSFGFNFKLTDYYARIRSIEGPISRVYKLDLIKSLFRINKEILLKKLEAIVSNTDIIQLFKEFLYIPIHHGGEDFTSIMNNMIPTCEFFTDILLNFYLIELDHKFHQVFPSFSYTRYANEVIVTTSQKESLFSSSLFSLLDSLNLDGQIVSIGPGDQPIPCLKGGQIRLSKDGRLGLQIEVESLFSESLFP